MYTGEGEVLEAVAARIIRGWIEFSTLRYYAVSLFPVKVERSGDVVFTLTLRVPHSEIARVLWSARKESPHG